MAVALTTAVIVSIVLSLLLFAPHNLLAADLEPRTAEAYHAYIERAQHAFEEHLPRDPQRIPQTDRIIAGPVSGDGITGVPGGLVHDWTGSVFIRGVTLDSVIRISQEYSRESSIYKDVIESRVLGHEGNTYRVFTRLREHGAGVTAILDITSTIRYTYPTSRTAVMLSTSDDIRQVINGRDAKQLLPAGHDSGYLWRANEFSYFVEMDDGVYIESETVGLSRPFPPGLTWILKPLARRFGRRSVETSLAEFAAAVATSGTQARAR